MREDHEAVIGNPGQYSEPFHSRHCLLHPSSLLRVRQRLEPAITVGEEELLVVVVVAVDAD